MECRLAQDWDLKKLWVEKVSDKGFRRSPQRRWWVNDLKRQTEFVLARILSVICYLPLRMPYMMRNKISADEGEVKD
jgi:hypothetical protein